MITGKCGLPVILLCGGKGERLRPLTTQIPKPLIPIKGHPIIWYIIEHIKKYSLKKLIVATGYKSEKIREYFLCNHTDMESIIIDSGNVDIIKRILDSNKHIPSDFLVFYGDTLSDINIEGLIEFHNSRKEKATITVWPMRSQFGLVDIDTEGKVLTFDEKPALNKWINIGYFYFEHKAISMMKGFDRFEDFLQFLAVEGELNAYKHNGIHITVNTMKELEEAEDNISKIFQG